MTFDQADFDIRCEWGERGVAVLAPISDALIIVDVMSFSTCVSIAVVRGATVFPYRWGDDSRFTYARSVNAELAGSRGKSRFSLSPASMMELSQGDRIVLPSPNGSSLTLSTGPTPTLAGCLRNSQAVARAAGKFGRRISVIPAGEKWREDNTLRPAYEDLLGAGAIIRHLEGTRSPEARLAEQAFLGAQEDLLGHLRECASGKELREKGFEEDIALLAELDVDGCAPIFKDGAYQAARELLHD
jgi:2-phosphosulfolactate phosphatase